MIQEFVEQWDKNKDLLREALVKKAPYEYKDLVVLVASVMKGKINLDPSSVVEISGDDYQGTNLYIIKGVPNGWYGTNFYSVKVEYGSCSGCDTLEHIKMDLEDEEAIKAYMTLCLHIVQEIKEA